MRVLPSSLVLMAIVAPAWSGTPPPPSTLREVQQRSVAPDGAIPPDLVSPEGKTRWHLESIVLGSAADVAIRTEPQGFVRETRRSGAAAPERLSVSGSDARRWLLPDQDPAQMKMGARVSLQFDETRDGLADRLVAEVATVGIGWLHLPGDPQEVVLQRVVLLRQRAGERAMRPELLIHRFVSPREGVLAEISGPASADGRTRLAVGSIDVVDRVLSGAGSLKIYADNLYRGDFIDAKFGWNKGPGAAPSSLVPDAGINNVCDLVNLTTWNFSGVTTGQETATTDTPSTAAETCNAARCGFQGYPVGGGVQTPILERLDSNLTGTIRKDNQVVQREDRATDVTFWLRSGAQNENKSGFFGSGESRFCFTDETGKPRNEVPLWQMAHNDAGGWYTQAGDTWSSVPVVSKVCASNPAKTCSVDTDCLAAERPCVCQGSNCCQETFYTTVCGATQPLTPNPLYGQACTSSGQTYGGKQSGKIVKGGVVTLPSGHTLNTLVVRNTTEFCVYSDAACGSLLDKVRTIVYYWQAPYVGSVALIRGPRRVDFAAGEVGETPCTAFTSLDFTDIGYGLWPPVSITAGAVTDTTVALSWNPGNDTHRINGYKVYWDTDPGASTAYAFNSAANPGQASIVGTTATISGLTPGTTYYFTVTSLSDFTDPSTSAVTHYESIRYPTTVSGDPNFSYPVEVQATTTGGTCIPAAAITGVTVNKALPSVHVCWNPTADACAVGYDVLTSNTGPGGFSVLGQTGLTTCMDVNPASVNPLVLIQVRARGTGGEGP
jgi:hypothetical protein